MFDLITNHVLTDSPSRGGDVAVCVFDIHQLSLLTPFYYILAAVSVFMALSTVCHAINSPDNCPLSHTLFFRSYFRLIGPFNRISLYESLPMPRYNLCGLTGFKHQLTSVFSRLAKKKRVQD